MATSSLVAANSFVARLSDLSAAAAANQYTDIFLRENLADTGTVPAPPPMAQSPDIIPSGLSPVSDPGSFFSKNYNQDVGQNLIANAQNYIYMRGKNLMNGPETGTLSLYYSPASLILYPSMWQKNKLSTSSGVTAVPVSAQNLGDIVVGADPFAWTPQMPSPGDHFCLIGQVVTPSNPNPIPATGAISDFSKWVAENRGIGWRNVVVVDTGSPTITQSVPYAQGTEAGGMYVAIQGKGIPAGAQVSFSCGTPGPNPLINMKPYTATGTDFLVGIPTNIPANFSSSISYSYYANNTTPLPGWSLSISVFYFAPPSSSAHAKGISLDALGITGKALDVLGPTKAILVGAQTMVPKS
jgi:hypothetical protein